MRRHLLSQETNSTPFVIFATQRTGSSWLMDMLNAHPTVASYDELLRAGAIGSGGWGRTDLEFFEPYYVRNRKYDNRFARTLWSFRYLNALYSTRRGTEAIGMKLMYNQLWQNPWVLIYMMCRRVYVVHLVRTNLLDVIISGETAEARQRYHAWEGEVVETPAVILDPKTVISTLQTLDRRIKIARVLLTLLPISHTEVSYEQLVSNHHLIDDIFTFLDVSRQAGSTTLVSRFKKLNTSGKSDLVQNYAEIERALRGTRFECFLDK